MRKNVADDDDLLRIVNQYDQPISVALQVKHRERSNVVGRREVGFELRKIAPFRCRSRRSPYCQRACQICVPSRRFLERHLAQDPHAGSRLASAPACCQYANIGDGGKQRSSSRNTRRAGDFCPVRPLEMLGLAGAVAPRFSAVLADAPLGPLLGRGSAKGNRTRR